MKRAVGLFGVLVFAGALFAGPASADERDPVWEKFTAARRAFQLRLCDLASRRWPEYAQFFQAHRDLQLSYIERRNLVFYHFRRAEPDRIVRDKGGEAFLNFGWSEEDHVRFLKEVPGYDTLFQEIQALQKRVSAFKKRDVLRDRFERLEIDPEYLALMREMTRAVTDAERQLAQSEAKPAAR